MDTKERVCCHLSGGLDSSVIASIMSRKSSEPISCFTLCFEEDSRYNEFFFQKLMADYLNANLYPVSVTAYDLLTSLLQAIYHAEGLCINAHLSAKYCLNQSIHDQGFKVVLSGEGADELFMGYSHLQCDFLKSKQVSEDTIQAIHKRHQTGTGIHFDDNQTLDLSVIDSFLVIFPHLFQQNLRLGIVFLNF